MVPEYLNTACLPFAQSYYSMDSYDKLRYHHSKSIDQEYLHALRDEEERRHLIKFA